MTENPPQDATRQPAGKMRAIAAAFMVILVAASLAYVGLQIHRGWSALAQREFSFDPGLLAISFLLLLLNFIITAWAWSVIFRDIEGPISIAHAFSIIYIAQIGRYLPGKVWAILGQMNVAQNLGYRKTTTLTAGAVHIICGALGASAVLAMSLFIRGDPPWLALLALSLGLAGLGALMLAPAMVENWINRLRKVKADDRIRLAASKKAVLKIYLIMVLSWVEHCLAFAMLAASMVSISLPDALDLAIAFNLAYWAGFVVLLAPGGLGVREGALTAMMTPLIGAAPSGVVALVQRLWVLLGEAIAFAIAIAIYRVARSRKG